MLLPLQLLYQLGHVVEGETGAEAEGPGPEPNGRSGWSCRTVRPRRSAAFTTSMKLFPVVRERSRSLAATSSSNVVSDLHAPHGQGQAHVALADDHDKPTRPWIAEPFRDPRRSVLGAGLGRASRPRAVSPPGP